ncbi:MAG: electron transport complex subunit RsxC [Chromatiales bacterium]|jgi:electron transport complex protein RnfC
MQNTALKTTHRKLWKFHGGLHIPDHKDMSLQQSCHTLAIPAKLVVPLQQHIGEAPNLIVKVGDQVAKGQMLAQPKDYVSAPIHAPSSGTITAIDEQQVPHPSGLTGLCVTIETDGQDRWGDDLPEPMADYLATAASKLRERIRWAGIVGMGGATFPSGVKLNPGPDKKIHTLIINGAECEPYITCDDTLMRENAADIIDGVQITMHILDVEQCLIGIEDNKPQAIASLEQAVADAGLNNIEVVGIPTLYPSGGEKQLIKILTGAEVPSHGLPADIGLVCHNVATVAAIADAVLRGRPLISRIVTVTGAGVRQPQNLRVANGTLISELVQAAGGYTDQVERLVLGGPMMGFTLSDDQVPVTKGANCVLVLTPEEVPATSPAVACIRCGKCAEVCPARLLPQQLYWYSRAKDLDKAQDYNLFDCIECGCCAYVCPSHIPLVQYYRFAKTEVWAKEEEKRKSDLARRRHAFKDARLARIEAEKQERLRLKKEALKKKEAASSDDDPKKAAIQAAMQRAAEKKKQRQAQGEQPKNIDKLSSAQQKQVDAANQRREKDPT